MKLSLSFGQRLALLFLLFVVGIILTSLVQVLAGRLTDNVVAATRIVFVIQDLLAFILPALITAMLITRLPADFLRLRTLPSGRMFLLAIVAIVVCQPAIDGVNRLCEALPWPQAILDLEATLAATTRSLIGPHDAANLLVSLLVMAVLTGLAEEIFFRGALQRLLETRPMSVHLAVWLAAVIFALMHGQPVGLLPRTLLGAMFGYLTVWSGSLWTAVVCHALNNGLAVWTQWAGIDFVSTPAVSVASAALTAAVIYLMCRRNQSRSRSSGI